MTTVSNPGPRMADDPGVERALVRRIRAAVAAELAARTELAGPDRDALAAELVARALAEHAAQALRAGRAALGDAEEARVAQAVLDAFSGLGRLGPLLGEDSWTDLHAEGTEPVTVNLLDGTTARWEPVADSDEELVELIRALGRNEGISERRFDLAHPQLNVQLRDGSRLFAVGWVTARPHLFLRRHHHLVVSLDDLVGLGSLDADLARFLTAAVRARLSILVGGGTGAGKTTMLRALAAAAEPDERWVTVETDYELGLDRNRASHRSVIAMESREANVEGAGAVSCADLVRWAMRMTSPRLAVGEVLGAEVIPMLNAMHSGAAVLSTVHANSSADVLDKLSILALQAPERLEPAHTYALAARAVDLVVFMAQLDGGRRVVASVRELTGSDAGQVLTNELWAPGPDGAARRSGVSISERRRRALAAAGWSPR